MSEITARKDHKCSFCGRTIKKGSSCDFFKGKGPRFNDLDEQIGIRYWRDWFCGGTDKAGCIELED